MAGTISRVPVKTSAEKRITRVEKVCITKVEKVCIAKTEAGKVISWKS